MPRTINFEGRRISVPDDASDDEVAAIIDGPAATAGTPAPAARGPQMTPEQADMAVSGLTPAPAAETRPALQGDSVAGVAKATAQGGVSGIDQLIDAPVNLINQAPRLLNLNGGLINKIFGREVVPTVGPISNNPLLPSDIIHAPDRALGSRQYEPQGPIERVANRVGQEVGASAIPGSAALIAGARLGPAGARALAMSENPLAALASGPVETAAVNPIGLVTREGAGATAAGLGAGLAGEAARGAGAGSGAQQGADLIGAILGGAGLAAAKPIAEGAKLVAGAVSGSPRFAQDIVKERVASGLIENSADAQAQVSRGVALDNIDTQGMANRLRTPSAAEEAIPGYQSDIADRSGDPGLAAFVYGQTRANPGRDTVRRAANQSAVEDRMAELAPTGSSGQFRSDLQTGVEGRIGAADTQAAEAEAQAQKLIAAIMPQTTPQARGATVRSAIDEAMQRFVADTQARQAATARSADEASTRLLPQSDPAVRGDVVRGALETSRDAARQRTADAYAQAEIGSRSTDIAPLTQSIDREIAGMTQTERGLVPQGLVDRVTALGRAAEDGTPAAPARLKEVTDLRSELDRAQRNAVADPRAENGGRNAARVIGRLQDHVESFITGNLDDAEQAAFAQARGARFDEAESFGRSGDPVSAAVARRPGGQPNMRDERVAGSFVNPATAQPLERLFQEADTPAVRSAIRDEIASRIGADARTDPARLDRFMADYEIPLRQFPGLREEIATAATARRDAAGAEAAVGARRQEFSGDSRALADTASRRSDGTPTLLDEQIPQRFVNPAGNRDMDALFARADTPDVRAALEDEILGRVQGSANRPAALRQQVEALREPLSRFPGLADRITSAADAGEAGTAARTAADTTRRDLTTPGRSPEASYLKYDAERTVDAVRSIVSQAKPAEAARQILATANGNPENARTALWELLKTETTTNGGVGASGRAETNGLRGSKLLNDPKFNAVAQELYKDQPKQLDDIKNVFSALAGANVSTRAKAPGSSGTPQAMNAKLDPGLSTGSLVSGFRSINRGQLSPTVFLAELAGRYIRKRTASVQSGAISNLQDEVIQNPALAAKLLEEYNPINYAAKRRELMQVGGARATEAVKLLDMAHDEDQRPEAAAVRRAAQ